MMCPKCFGYDTQLIGSTHYICTNENCSTENGNRVQFTFNVDDEKKFPYSQIFPNRPITGFYKKPYISINID